MSEPLRLLCVFAHPDDETLGVGSTLAKYASEGVETYLVTATRGEYGYQGWPAEDPGPAGMAALRTVELQAAAAALGLREVVLLDYLDGALDDAEPAPLVASLVAELRRIRPQVVITFGPDGSYGHPDHIAISQLTAAAIVCAADAGYTGEHGGPPHRVAKLYYMVDTKADVELYTEAFGPFVMEIDGRPRGPVGWDEWAISARIDGRAHGAATRRAVASHR
jgi:LmbE family N-acetylglucosaminyl deacetylase